MDHRSHNRISKIKDTQGNQLNTHKEIEVVLVPHFQGIVKEPLLDRSKFINDFTKHILKLVTREDNYNLNTPVNEEEFSEVIKEIQMGRCQDNAMAPDRFIPIALCNVVYKIISNRLKPLLSTLVSKEKTGYVEDRQILNNIIQAHEVVHSLISNR
eukprot:PITA_12279